LHGTLPKKPTVDVASHLLKHILLMWQKYIKHVDFCRNEQQMIYITAAGILPHFKFNI
jgi:hypothetical protein